MPAAEKVRWQEAGFTAFEAAMARGDGFTPLIASQYRHGLAKIVAGWKGAQLDSAEGLAWHRSGFTAKEAVRYRQDGIDPTAAARSRKVRPSG